MRTAIFIAGMLISESIDKYKVMSDRTITFLSIILIVFMVMDIFEFFKNMCK